jgi:asparagine synthase (glutamine-hydrolysing)
MCGITGIINKNKRVSKESIQLMTNKLEHRGPDGEGIWFNDKSTVGLGHRRLAIIDLSTTANQPFKMHDDKYIIVFNGEIFNYIELRDELVKLGFSFSTHSDTEVLLTAYIHYGEKCLNKLDGQFAFAIWDENRKILFCARDRFGEKPFFYNISDNQFAFASEMKSLWAIGIPKEPNTKRFESFLKTGKLENQNNTSETFFNNIISLRNGYQLIVDENLNISEKCYWNLDGVKINNSITVDEAANELLRLLSQSVERRLRSDVPVGSSLSGGIDSSAIVRLINQIKPKHQIQKTFSARFKNFSKDEGQHIKNALKNLEDVNDIYVWPDEEGFLETFEKLVYHHEEPFASSSMYAQYKVMETAAKNNIKVLIDGQGADEVLAGYPRFYRDYLNQLYFTNKPLYFEELNKYNSLREGIAPVIKGYHELETIRMKLGVMKSKLLKKPLPFDENSLTNKLKSETMTTGLQQLLRYADRNSMANSIEVRLPYLSHELVEFIFSLPDSYKLQDGWTKFILRKAVQPILPEEITWRIDKVGYETPQKNWLEKPVFKNELAKANKFVKENFNLSTIDTPEDWSVLMTYKSIK